MKTPNYDPLHQSAEDVAKKAAAERAQAEKAAREAAEARARAANPYHDMNLADRQRAEEAATRQRGEQERKQAIEHGWEAAQRVQNTLHGPEGSQAPARVSALYEPSKEGQETRVATGQQAPAPAPQGVTQSGNPARTSDRPGRVSTDLSDKVSRVEMTDGMAVRTARLQISERTDRSPPADDSAKPTDKNKGRSGRGGIE